MKPGTGFLWIILPTLLGFLTDQAIKFWIENHYLPGQSFELWPGIFHITYVQNSGAAFSLLAHSPQLLLGLSLLLFTGFLILTLKNGSRCKTEALGLGLIIGGALGNLLDRFRLGRVIDYLDVVCIHYPVFNLADSLIFIGVFLLLWTYWKQARIAPVQ